MDCFDEDQRHTLANIARKNGGIALRNQELKQHTNGVKFLINRSYISDKVLDPDLKYMLIIIPEIKDVIIDWKDGIKYEPIETDLMACLKAIADHFGFNYSLPMLFGGSGHAFMFNVHEQFEMPGACTWKIDSIMPLLSNLGLKVKKTKTIPANSTLEARKDVESIVKKNIDKNVPQFMINARCQLITGYNDYCFYVEPIKTPGMYPNQVTAGTWEELLTSLPVTFFSVEKGMVMDEKIIVEDSLYAAIDMYENPARWTSPPYHSGIDAIEKTRLFFNHMSKRLGEKYNERPFIEHEFWIWAENRLMASNYMGEISMCPAFGENVKEIAVTLQNNFKKIARLLRLQPHPELDNYEKLIILEKESLDYMKKILAIIE